MSASTTYDINVRYQLQDKPSKPAAKIGTELQKTARHGRSLLSTMKVVAAGAALGFGFRVGKKWLIDYNAQMDGAKIKMQTLLALGKKTDFASQFEQAGSLVKQMTKDAAVGVGTTQDYVEFAGEITKPLLDAGASMEQLTRLTKLGVTASKAFGMEGAVAGRDIQQMLMGNIKNVDRLPKLLGVASDKWNEMFRDKGPQYALRELEKVLDTKQMNDAATAYGKSWEGVTSTLEDNLQRTLGKVGLPLMELLSQEVKAMNDYFEKNPRKVEQFIKKAGKALVDGFGMVKDVVGFLVNNSGTLLSIAKAFIGFKLIQGAGGLLAGPFDMLASYSKKQALAGAATGTMADKMTAAGNKIQGVATMLALVYVGAKLLADKIDRDQEEDLKKIAMKPQGFLSAATGDTMKTGAESDAWVIAQARAAGLIGEGNRINRGRMANALAGRSGEMSEAGLQAGVSMADARSRSFGGEGGFAGMLTALEKRGGDAYKRLATLLAAEREKEGKAFRENIRQMGTSLLQFLKQGGNMAAWNREAGFDQDGVSDPHFSMITGEGTVKDISGAEPKATKKNGDVKVYINTIKVAADDPDRFAMRMVGAFKKATNKPVASRLGSTVGGRPR